MSKKSSFSDNLRREIKARNLTVPEVAKLAHVQRQAVYRWLNGEPATQSHVEALSRAWGIPPSAPLFGQDSIDEDVLRDVIARCWDTVQAQRTPITGLKFGTLCCLLYKQAVSNRAAVGTAELRTLLSLAS